MFKLWLIFYCHNVAVSSTKIRNEYYQRKKQRYVIKFRRDVTFSLGKVVLWLKSGHTRPLALRFLLPLVVGMKFKPGWGVDSDNWPIVDRT
jgi:hypothetical protein